MKKNITRILIGLLAIFLINLMYARFISPSLMGEDGFSGVGGPEIPLRLMAIGGLVWFMSCAVGGLIAREKFVVPLIAYLGAFLAYDLYVIFSNLAASGALRSGVVSSILSSILFGLSMDVVIGVAGALAGMKSIELIGVHKEFVRRNPGWPSMYRYYLYFGLLLRFIGLFLSFTVFGTSFRVAVINIAIAIFVLSSLPRLQEKRVAVFHLVFNAATLLSALIVLSMGGAGLELFLAFGSVQWLIQVVGADFDALVLILIAVADAMNHFGYGGYELSGGLLFAFGGITVTFGLLSAYWIWNFYKLLSAPRDGDANEEQSADARDERFASSPSNARVVWYVGMPFVISLVLGGLIAFAPAGLAMMTNASPFLIYMSLSMHIGTEVVFIGAVWSVYRIGKLLI